MIDVKIYLLALQDMSFLRSNCEYEQMDKKQLNI